MSSVVFCSFLNSCPFVVKGQDTEGKDHGYHGCVGDRTTNVQSGLIHSVDVSDTRLSHCQMVGAVDSFAPAHSAFGLPVCVAASRLAPLTRTACGD
jgi:hypothetical protein